MFVAGIGPLLTQAAASFTGLASYTQPPEITLASSATAMIHVHSGHVFLIKPLSYYTMQMYENGILGFVVIYFIVVRSLFSK